MLNLLRRKYRKQLVVLVFACYLAVMIANNIVHESHHISRPGLMSLEKPTTKNGAQNIRPVMFTTEIPLSFTTSTNQMMAIESIMAKRYQIQRKACATMENYSRNSPEHNFRAHVQLVTDHRMVYCGIEKIGSTFWRRLIQLIRLSKIDTPYSIKPEDTNKNYKSFLKENITNYSQILATNTKFIFVRDPYSRLLSGYVDKIYSPNYYFWNLIGRPAVNFTRKLKYHCGHDLSFPEFVQYFIHTEERGVARDEHFLPSSDHCRPCEVKYDYIGKMESFSEDVLFILEKFNLQNYSRTLVNFKNQSIIDTIYDTAHAEVSMRRYNKRCLSIYQGLQRIWRKMQIRGVISDEIIFPFRKSDAHFVNELILRGELLKAHITSRKKYNLNSQKRKYLIEAYNLLSLETMNKLQNIFKNDFIIFGYDQRPEHLFLPRNNTVKDIFKINL